MRSISPAGRSPPRLVRAGRQPGNSTSGARMPSS